MADLEALSIVSGNDVWAVGSQPSGVLIEHWDGSAWSVIDAPTPEDHGFLTAVDAAGPNDVWAASPDGPGNQATPPVVDHYDGTQWEIVELPDAAPYAVPLAVTAVSAQGVWIAGWTAASNRSDDYAGYRALVAHWDGSAWTYPDTGLEQPPQVISGATEALGSVVFVGSEGGSFSGMDGSIQGDRSLAVFGQCAG